MTSSERHFYDVYAVKVFFSNFYQVVCTTFKGMWGLFTTSAGNIFLI